MKEREIRKKVKEELKKARSKFPSWPMRKTDALSVLAEEAGEALEIVNMMMVSMMVEKVGKAQSAAMEYYYPECNKTGDDPLKRLDEELIQTIAMCYRCLMGR